MVQFVQLDVEDPVGWDGAKTRHHKELGFVISVGSVCLP